MPSSLSPTPPDQDATIPLLVRMPDGSVEQVDIPPNAPVSSITAALPEKLSPDVRLSFANTVLDPDATLLDANIAPAYAHANSLLNLIDSSNPDAEKKAAALDSAIAVVERVSNGVKSMSALCAAAASEDLPPDVSEETAESATPEQLARSLTLRLPKLFGPVNDPLADIPQPQQPSISSIREARRVMRDISLPKDERDIPLSDDHHIGQSTNAPISLPSQLQQKPLTNDGIVLANSQKSTWLEDVKTTWEVDTVRQSGILSTSKLGLELDDYLKTLEEEQDQSQDDNAPDNELDNELDNECPGDSSDEEQILIIPPNGSAPVSQASTDPSVPHPGPDVNMTSPVHAAAPGNTNALSAPQQATNLKPELSSRGPANSHLSSESPPAPVSTLTPSITTQGSTTSSAPIASRAMLMGSKSPSPSGVSNLGFPSPSVDSQPSVPAAPIAPNNRQESRLPSQPRQAAKIAPALLLPRSQLPANGVFGTTGIPMPRSQWQGHVVPHMPAKKKRGRKRKNPELTEEERILWRKQQNRESAKLSRVRRKVIAAEYEGRINALINENTLLRKQVDGLSNRLAYMQNLLTVSVINAPQPPS
ncbi:unnamed protein product [Agarophyton chilense]